MSVLHNVPPELSSFVGRSDELTTIGAAVSAGQVLTLAGPGGCGKTRLAIQVCHDQVARWRDGAWWIGLEDEQDDDAAGRRIARALGVAVPLSTDPVSAVVESRRDHELLIVLDNCEHLLGAVQSAVQALRAGCPQSSIIVTSRVALGVEGERIWRVPPLELDDALNLFLQRADATGAPVDPSRRTASRRICDRLDRLPLALELAAGWAGTLTLEQIADSMSKPYDLLGGGDRTAPFRQQTLEASMRWSYDLLNDDEQVLFRHLGAFEPGFDMAAVADLTSPEFSRDRALRALRGLVDKSLLVADTTSGAARYRMLGVVRDYALARLHAATEAEPVLDRHLDLYLARVKDRAPLLETDKDAWRAALHPEYPNIRAAIEWGLTRDDPSRGQALAAGAVWLWQLDGRGHEGLRLLRLAADMGRGERTARQANVLLALALVATEVVPGGEPFEIAAQAAELAAETGAAADGRLARSLAAVGMLGTDLEAARAAAIAVRDEAAIAGDGFVADASDALAGLTHLLRDDHTLAVSHLERAVEGLAERGDRDVASSGMSWLATALMHLGDLQRATEYAERAVATAEPLCDFHRISIASGVLAEVRTWQGRYDDAEAALAPLERFMTSAEPPFAPDWRRARAVLALAQGEPKVAAEWCRPDVGSYPAQTTPDTDVVLATALRKMDDHAAATTVVEKLLADPTVKDMPRVLAGALHEHARLTHAASPERALDLAYEALRVSFDNGLVLGCIDGLESLAEAQLQRRATEQVGVLAGAAQQARLDAGARDGPVLADDPEFVGAMDRGREMALSEAVAYALRARGPRRRPDTGWESLTPTERSVVELAVEGLSNPQIATRLFMGRGTVKTHLGHVYAKLGVANRTELARHSAERRLDLT